MYEYFIGPFEFFSEFEFPELSVLSPAKSFVTSRIELHQGIVQGPSEEAKEITNWCFKDKGQIFVEIESLGKFCIRTDNSVIVQPDQEAEHTGDWRACFLGPVLNLLCLQSNYLAIHSCAFASEEGAFLIGGESGDGKSTLAATLRSRGIKALSDDLSIIAEDKNGELRVFPSYPTARLWSDTLGHFQQSEGELTRVHQETDKFLVPTREDFYCNPLPPENIFLLKNTRSGPVVSSSRQSGLAAITTLVELTHRRFLVSGLGKEELNFKQCQQLAQRTRVDVLNRQWGLEYIDQTVEFILDEVARR